MEKDIQKAMNQQTEEHQRITNLVIETVDYGQKITALQNDSVRQEEQIKELKEINAKAEAWKMKAIGWVIGLAVTLGGPMIFMWSSIQQYELRFTRNEATIENHRKAFDELYDNVSMLQTDIAVLKSNQDEH